MRCPVCDYENRDGIRACAGCGAVHESACSSCGELLPVGARFCSGCGRPATARDGSGEPPPERRQLSVMFVDMVASTQLARRLGAEEFTELLTAYQELCKKNIERFGGRVAQYRGDGVLVYFGHPQAHEDDAVRAVSAAISIRDAIPELNEHLKPQFSPLSEQP